jgi:glycerol-3-phosphate dehydrogenase subunit C
MTVTYDPSHPAYFDEGDLRDELTRVYDLCHGCRLCWNLCTSFPTLFEMIDDIPDQDAAKLTPAQQDQVVDECFQCKICYVKCPYIPPHEWQLDFPRLMLRAAAVKKTHASVMTRVTDNALGRTDLSGRAGVLASPLANKVMGSPNSAPRKLMEKVTGIAASRVLPPYAKQRFTSWFKKRAKPSFEAKDRAKGQVSIFPTCLVEYQATSVGKATVQVYERNGIACNVADGVKCCGAPFLHEGDFDNFKKYAEKNVKVLADEVRAGRDIVVPQPTCGYVLKNDYFDHLGEGDDTRLVKEHTYDVAEYLMKVHKQRKDADGTGLDTEFTGSIPESITYHVPCHLQAQNIGLKSRDLMKLTGTKIQLANQCSGIDGMWGYRAENQELQQKVIQGLKKTIEQQDAPMVVGDCHLANGGINDATGRQPIHPMEFVARAYGIDDVE